jgi:NAD(P)H-dependent FMN reductase
MSKKIAVIVGSTRPNRIGRQITDWFIENVVDAPDAEFEIIDLKEVNLPFLDEEHVPGTGIYEKEHTKKWKALVDSFDGYIFVTPEYNAGYSAPLKNAIDYLKAEWANKPAMIISYGWGGGASASAQLRQVLERLQMRPTKTSPALFFGKDTFDEKSELKDAHTSFVAHADDINRAVKELEVLANAEVVVAA